MPSANKRRMVLISATLLFLIILGVILIASQSHKTPSNSSSGSYIDPLSHETVSNPPGIAPEHYGSNTSAPIYLGFDKLLNYGLTNNQIVSIEQAFYNYSQSQSPHIAQVSVDVDHITAQHDPADPNSPFLVLFNVGLDKKIYKAKVDYSNLDLASIQLYLTDSTGKSIFSSGQVNGN